MATYDGFRKTSARYDMYSCLYLDLLFLQYCKSRHINGTIGHNTDTNRKRYL